MKIVITGAAGFIGSHLKTRFEKEGFEVIGIDNYITSKRNDSGNIDFKDGIRSENVTDVKIPPCDGILHFASPASPKDFGKYWREIYKANVIGMDNILYQSSAWKNKVIFASTSEIYGDAVIHPQPEDYHGNVNTLGGRAIYDESKRMAETLCANYRKHLGLNVQIARIFNTYGAGMPEDGRILDACKESLKTNQELIINGEGEQTRSFCYITDTVEAIWKLFNYQGKEWVFNIGNPQEITVNQFVETFEGLVGVTLPKRYNGKLDEPVRRRPDISRAEEHLDWKPQIPLYQGLAQTLKNEGIIHED